MRQSFKTIGTEIKLRFNLTLNDLLLSTVKYTENIKLDWVGALFSGLLSNLDTIWINCINQTKGCMNIGFLCLLLELSSLNPSAICCCTEMSLIDVSGCGRDFCFITCYAVTAIPLIGIILSFFYYNL